MAHLVSYSSFPSPKISFWDGKVIRFKPLSGQVSFRFSQDVFCTGHYDGEKYEKCNFSSTGSRPCRPCAYLDISKVYTRFDFTGYEHMQEAIESTPYSVYLASFGKGTIKC